MAAQFAALGLNAAVPVIQNYDKILDRSKETVKKVPFPGRKNRRASSGHYDQEEYDQSMDNYNAPRRGSVDRSSYRPPRGYYYDQEPQYAPRDTYSPPRESFEEIQRDFPPPGKSFTQPLDRGAADGYYKSFRTTTRDYRPRGQSLFHVANFLLNSFSRWLARKR